MADERMAPPPAPGGRRVYLGRLPPGESDCYQDPHLSQRVNNGTHYCQ